MKKLVSLLLCAAMVLALAACGSAPASSSTASAGSASTDTAAAAPADDTVYELKLSTTQTENSMIYAGMKAAADKILADTDGHVKVTIYPSSQLGAEEDMIDQALQGMGIAVLTDAGRLSSYVKDIGIMNMAYVPSWVTRNTRLLPTSRALSSALPALIPTPAPLKLSALPPTT